MFMIEIAIATAVVVSVVSVSLACWDGYRRALKARMAIAEMDNEELNKRIVDLEEGLDKLAERVRREVTKNAMKR